MSLVFTRKSPNTRRGVRGPRLRRSERALGHGTGRGGGLAVFGIRVPTPSRPTRTRYILFVGDGRVVRAGLATRRRRSSVANRLRARERKSRVQRRKRAVRSLRLLFSACARPRVRPPIRRDRFASPSRVFVPSRSFSFGTYGAAACVCVCVIIYECYNITHTNVMILLLLRCDAYVVHGHRGAEEGFRAVEGGKLYGPSASARGTAFKDGSRGDRE